MNAFDFTSKVVIVTGASSGIGAATAILFAEFGAKLVLVGRNEERLKTVFVQCHQARGVKPLYLQLDLTGKFSCEKVISATVSEFGRIDVLVNSAGKLLLGSLFDEESDVLDELIDIYIKVPYKLTNLAIPHLVKTKGNIVNVASTNDRQRQGFLPQFIAQHGLSNFTKLAASELASAGVRINSVNPGITRTNILKNIGLSELEISHTYEKLMTSLNIKVLEPSEVARMIVFIASDVCPGMNGADMRIDGGLQS